MERSDTIAELATALAAFNASVVNPTAGKTATVQPRDKTKRAFTFPFTDLATVTAAVRPLLAEHGLSVLQEVEERAQMIGAHTWLLHQSGEWLHFSPIWIPAGNEAKDIGGAVTYSRRYGLLAALDLAPEDDGSAPTQRRPEPPPAPTREITDEEYAAVETKWRTKGKSNDWTSALLAKGGYSGPLEFMPRSAYDFLMRDLDKLPDVADPVSGEVVEMDETKAAPGETQGPVDETIALAGETFDGSDDVPGMDAEQFAATRDRQAQEHDEERLPLTSQPSDETETS